MAHEGWVSHGSDSSWFRLPVAWGDVCVHTSTAFPNKWYVTCRPVEFDYQALGATEKEEAKAEGVRRVRLKLMEMLGVIDEHLKGDGA